jgi:hypothetical protein
LAELIVLVEVADLLAAVVRRDVAPEDLAFVGVRRLPSEGVGKARTAPAVATALDVDGRDSFGVEEVLHLKRGRGPKGPDVGEDVVLEHELAHQGGGL